MKDHTNNILDMLYSFLKTQKSTNFILHEFLKNSIVMHGLHK